MQTATFLRRTILRRTLTTLCLLTTLVLTQRVAKAGVPAALPGPRSVEALELNPVPAEATIQGSPGEQPRRPFVHLPPTPYHRAAADSDSTALSKEEAWENITPEQVNHGTMSLPLSGDVAGPSVLRVQILLDRAQVSPGILDGRWGQNTEKAVYWFQRREGLEATGTVDSTTFLRMLAVAGVPDPWIGTYHLTSEVTDRPFTEIPSDIYERAQLNTMGYESLSEQLSETFHLTPELLSQLNPYATIDSLQAGFVVHVPNLNTAAPPTEASVARLVISGNGQYTHAMDSTGRLLYHFPSTLGSSYDPSPTGNYTITSITEYPWWHYQPTLLEDVPDDGPDATIPPGPNNAVGVVWMALSEPHYGIHGTAAPETIGYVTSAGCVRLTNWDALFLARRLEPGTPVEFREVARPEE